MYIKGRVRNLDELLAKIINYVCDSQHQSMKWEIVRNEPYPSGVVFKCPRKNGDHYYAGMLLNHIKVGETYSKWFSDWKLAMAYGAFNAMWQDGVPEIFLSDACAIHFNIFKGYDANLHWDEQPGSVDMSNMRSLVSPAVFPPEYKLPWRPIKLPLSPGVGCPSISTDYDGPIDGYMDYWLIKDAEQLTIIVKNRDKWEFAALGMLNAYDDGYYDFPAFIAASTSGAVPYGKDRFYYSGQTTPSIDSGYMFDYSASVTSATHSMPTYATVPIDKDTNQPGAAPSAVVMMLPDGLWQSAANNVQTIVPVSEFKCSGPISKHFFFMSDITKSENIQAFLRPTENSTVNFKNVISNEDNLFKYKVEPLEFVLRKKDQTGVIGNIGRLGYSSHEIRHFGEFTMDGVEHLVMPNIWENRLIGPEVPLDIIRNGPNAILGYLSDGQAQLTEYKRKCKNTNAMNMIVKLGD